MEKSNLDLMRAIAVSLVVVDHNLLAGKVLQLGPWYVGRMGLFGVYIFFVHTCLVLMWSLERRPHTLNFYIRRAFRIYPLAVLAIFGALALHSPFVADDGTYTFHAYGGVKEVVLNCLLLQNFVVGVHTIWGVMWSLPPEVDMYILLPAFFSFASRLRSVWPLLLVWGMATAYVQHRFGWNPGNGFLTVVPDFIPGVIAYVGFRKRRETVPAWVFPVFLAVLFVLVMSFTGFRMDWWTSLALGLALPAIRQVENRWVTQLSATLAKYSYGIYLMHPFGIHVGMYLLRGLSAWVRLPVSLLVTAALAVVCFRLVEHPMIRLGTRIAAKLERRHGVDNLRSGPLPG